MPFQTVPKSPRRVDSVFKLPITNVSKIAPAPTENTQLKALPSLTSLPSLEQISSPSILSEIKLLLSRSWLISLQQLCSIFSAIITIGFIGQLKGENSAQLIAGVGLSASFTNVLSVAICTGLTIALGTLLPQCIAAGHKHLATIHIQRAWYLISILAIFLCTIQYFAGDIMIAIGQPMELRDIVNSYCRLLIPSTFIEVIILVLNPLIQSLDMNKYLFFINLIALILFIPLVYCLIYLTSLSYLGGAISIVIYMFFIAMGQIFLLCTHGYAHIFKPLPLSIIFRWNGCVTYIKLALPGVFQESFEWIILEIAVLLSGYVKDAPIAISTTVIMQQLDLLIFSFSYGCAQSTSLRLAEYIGVGSIFYAKRTAKIGIFLVSCINAIFLICLAVSRKELGGLWTSDRLVIDEVALLVFVYEIFAFSDTNKQMMMGIYRGLGFQHTSAIFVFVTYFFFVLPLLIVMLFVFGYKNDLSIGLYAIWTGLTLGNVVSFCLITFWIFCGCVDWNKSVINAKARFEEAHKHLNMKNYKSISSQRMF